MEQTEDDIRQIIKNEDLPDSEKFIRWFKKRFSTWQHSSYVLEWAGRFKTGHPEQFMDEDSLSLWVK